jgi:hypothetical protein
MLFDLRGAGRRNTVRAIYLGLAILMGGGLVFFGVGGNTGGGLLNAVNQNGGSGSSGTSFTDRVKKLETRVRVNPQNATAWAQLAIARFQLTNTAANYDQSTSSFTPAGKVALHSAEQAWDRYTALNPKKPDTAVARVMVQVFSSSGLNEPAKAVAAEELIAANSKPTSDLYKQLAALAYVAGQTRKGDLSAAKAVSLAPKAQRAALRQQLAQYKTQLAAQQATATTTTP